MNSMKFVILFSCIAFAVPAVVDPNIFTNLYANEDATLAVPELIVKYGYPCETHSVTTHDGYVLTMHRIPHGRSGVKPKGRSVFIQHGVLSSSADWIIAGVDRGLAPDGLVNLISSSASRTFMAEIGISFSTSLATLACPITALSPHQFPASRILKCDAIASLLTQMGSDGSIVIGYIMADEGYDVWMGNGRGNHFSRNHTSLNPDQDPEFWHFSWHEIGAIDLPAMIDYVLKTTGEDKTFYIGHSQGTTSFYVMNSVHPIYNDKIRAMFSLAPIAYMSHMTSPLVHIMALWRKPLELLTNLIGMNEFLPNYGFMAMAGDRLCGDGDISQFLCTNSLFAICGFSEKEMNASLLPVLMGHTPAGSSTRQFLHFAQEVSSGRFRQYDFGRDGNLDTYGRVDPPDYLLKRVTAPVYLLYSHNDWLAGESDVGRLCDELGNCRGKFLASDNAFNHLDYMFGINAPKLVYNKVISLMYRHL